MLAPILISSVFVLAIVVLCLTKPNAGRIFLGIFFLLMGLGVNGYFTFGNPQSYLDYASGALIPFYRDMALMIVNINPVIFGMLLIIYEVIMGIFLLYKGSFVKAGLIGTILFLVAIAPLSYLQLPWLGMIIGQGYLLTKVFDQTLIDVIRKKG